MAILAPVFGGEKNWRLPLDVTVNFRLHLKPEFTSDRLSKKALVFSYLGHFGGYFNENARGFKRYQGNH
jgi:hypothetical protein